MLQAKFFLKNTLSNYFIIFIKLVIGVWALPTYLQAFGKENYGLFLLAFELPQLLSFLDLGAAKSILRYTAQYNHDKDLKKYNDALGVNVTLALITSLVVSVVIVLIGFTSAYIYDLSAEQSRLAIFLFLISGISSLFIFLDFIPLNILSGSNIFHDRNKLQLFVVAFNLGLILIAKYTGISIIAFGILFATGYLFTLLLDCWLIKIRNILKGISLKVVSLSHVWHSGFMRYNMQLFGLSLIAVFSSQADKQIIGIIVGLQAVTIYVVITKVYYVVKGLLGNFYAVLRPTLAVANNYPRPRLQKIFQITTQSLALVLALISIYVFFLWPFVSNVWMNSNEYAGYSVYVALAVLNLSLASLAGTFISYFSLTDKAMIVVKADFFTVLINVIVSVIFCIKFGPVGAILGTTAQMLLNAIWYLYIGQKQKLVDFSSYFSYSFILSITIILVNFYIALQFELSTLYKVISCITSTCFVLFHLYKLNIYTMFNKKASLAI